MEEDNKITEKEIEEIEAIEANGEPTLDEEMLEKLMAEQLIEDNAELEELAKISYEQALADYEAEQGSRQ